MAGVINEIGMTILSYYKEFLGFFPSYIAQIINLMITVFLVVVYSIIVWKFYRFVSRRNPLGLDLSRYNKAQSSFLRKLFSAFLYFVEYIIIFPFVIFVIFVGFTFLLIILTETTDIAHLLIVSAVIIATIRVTAYYQEELSRDIAKLIPLMLLTLMVINPLFLAETQYLEQVILRLVQIPQFISEIGYYLIFIIILEAVLLFFDYLFSLLGIVEDREEEY